MEKKYTVYKITNTINNKTYIGVHKTDNPNDDYMGSGIAIKSAISKYGKDKFTKGVLAIFHEKSDAYDLEYKLTEDYTSPANYNMKRGGFGGWPESARIEAKKHINIALRVANGIKSRDNKLGIHAQTPEERVEFGRKGGLANKGVKKTKEHIEKIRQAALNRWNKN